MTRERAGGEWASRGWTGSCSPRAEGLLEWVRPGMEAGRVKAGVRAAELVLGLQREGADQPRRMGAWLRATDPGARAAEVVLALRAGVWPFLDGHEAGAISTPMFLGPEAFTDV